MNFWKRNLIRNKLINDRVTEELKEFSMEQIASAISPKPSAVKQKMIALLGLILLALCAGGAGFLLGYEIHS